jgi:hypothetical protein
MLLSRIGPIALEEPLGGSADSNVLRGIHLERNKTLAVKLLPRHVVDRPMGGDSYAEAVHRLQALVHPHIARVLGGAMENGQPYLALELVKGESLRELLDRRGRLPWETMVDYAQQICDALAYAHEHGVVHGRLTPSRILIADDNAVKIVGFDCALADHDAVVGLKAPLSVLNYLAPQEIRGKRSVGLPSNDLFSLGVILYEGLCGELPWPARTPVDLVRAREAASAPRASAKVLDLPVWLDVLVDRMLRVRREGRFESADEARRAIYVAKDKAAAGVGAAKHALSGKQGALKMGVGKQELRELRKAAAASEKSRDDGSAFYERTWFLAACLAALVAGGAWFLWPLSEDALFAKAQPYMNSERVTDWQAAETLYLDDLMERFPDTKYKAQIDEFRLKHAIHDAEERIKNIDRFGRKPVFEIDRLYAEAWRYERFGDRLTAWRRYDALLALYPKSDKLEEQAIVELAKRHVADIRQSARDQQDDDSAALAALVRQKLDRAQALAATEPLAARELLESLIALYDGNLEVASMVDEAREQIRKLHDAN